MYVTFRLRERLSAPFRRARWAWIKVKLLGRRAGTRDGGFGLPMLVFFGGGVYIWNLDTTLCWECTEERWSGRRSHFLGVFAKVRYPRYPRCICSLHKPWESLRMETGLALGGLDILFATMEPMFLEGLFGWWSTR